jgi:hypothetical protein
MGGECMVRWEEKEGPVARTNTSTQPAIIFVSFLQIAPKPWRFYRPPDTSSEGVTGTLVKCTSKVRWSFMTIHFFYPYRLHWSACGAWFVAYELVGFNFEFCFEGGLLRLNYLIQQSTGIRLETFEFACSLFSCREAFAKVDGESLVVFDHPMQRVQFEGRWERSSGDKTWQSSKTLISNYRIMLKSNCNSLCLRAIIIGLVLGHFRLSDGWNGLICLVSLEETPHSLP